MDLCKAVLFSRQEDSTKHAVAMLGQVSPRCGCPLPRRGRTITTTAVTTTTTTTTPLHHHHHHQNASIEYLDIGTSQLADLGASLLAKTLRTNTTLRCLHLRSNQIGIVGGEALASMLMQVTTTMSLTML